MKNGIGRDFEGWMGVGLTEQENEGRLVRRNKLSLDNGNKHNLLMG